MDGDDVSTVTVKSARNVKRLAAHVGHEQSLGTRHVVRVLLYDVAGSDDMLQISMGNPARAHSDLRVQAYQIAVFLHSSAQGSDVELGHLGPSDNCDVLARAM
jgi:hypothetical protein